LSGVGGNKMVCLKEYEGVIRSTVLIDPQGLTRRFWPKAKTEGHAAEVLTELEKFS
jgi:peroxiredoxin Q/BCP